MITSHLGINPRRGGSPPSLNIVIIINIKITGFIDIMKFEKLAFMKFSFMRITINVIEITI